jgi:HK97 gp10 family phage protein
MKIKSYAPWAIDKAEGVVTRAEFLESQNAKAFTLSSHGGNSKFVKFQRVNFKEVLGTIKKKDSQLRMVAAKHLKEKIKTKISKSTEVSIGPKGGVSVERSSKGEPPRKDAGNLVRGLAIKGGPRVHYVGFKSPGHHAALLEFGSTKMKPRPFMFSTFGEEAETIKKILSEPRL